MYNILRFFALMGRSSVFTRLQQGVRVFLGDMVSIPIPQFFYRLHLAENKTVQAVVLSVNRCIVCGEYGKHRGDAETFL